MHEKNRFRARPCGLLHVIMLDLALYIYLGSSIEQLQYMIQVASPYSIRERDNTGMQGY